MPGSAKRINFSFGWETLPLGGWLLGDLILGYDRWCTDGLTRIRQRVYTLSSRPEGIPHQARGALGVRVNERTGVSVHPVMVQQGDKAFRK